MTSNPESARIFDAVFNGLTEPEIERARFKKEVLLQSLDLRGLTEEQARRLNEAVGRRGELAARDPLAARTQVAKLLLFEEGHEEILDASMAELAGDSDYDEAADLILALKRRLGRTGRIGGGEAVQEAFQGMKPEDLKELAKVVPGIESLMPPGMNFYSADYLLSSGYDSQRSWDKLRTNYFRFRLPDGLDSVMFDRLRDQDPDNITPENEEDLRRLQAWMLVADLVALKSGPFAQVARLAPQMYPTLGILGSTYPGLLFEGAGILRQFQELLKKRTEKAAPQLEEASPTSQHVAALLYAGRKPIPLELQNGRVEKFELGAAWSLDIMTGNTATLKENGAGLPTYSLMWGGRLRTGTFAEITMGMSDQERVLARRQCNPIWNGDVFNGRNVYGQQLYTESDMFLGELEKGKFTQQVLNQLKERGIELADLEMLWVLHENGLQLSRSHEIYRMRYQKVLGGLSRGDVGAMLTAGLIPEDKPGEAGGDFEVRARRAAAEHVINNVVVTTYGAYADMALGLADMLGFTQLWDVRQDYDHLNELWNKMMTTYPYDEKYAILPAFARKLMQSYIRNVISWKRMDVDPILIAMNGNKKEVTAAWQNPLSPEAAPIIPALTLIDGRSLGSLRDSDKTYTFPDSTTIKESELYDSITSTIEAVLYTKSAFRGGESRVRHAANHLVRLAERNPMLAEAQAVEYMDQYIAKHKTMAPQEFMSSRNEAAAKLEAVIDVRRQHLDIVNWKGVAETLGYRKEGLAAEEYYGVNGFSKVISVRSNQHLLVGEVQKWFKYMSKYPELAVAEGKALSKIVPALNNALNPLYENWLGGAPDQLSTLNADQFGEAVAKAVTNFLFIGRRKREEAWKYLQQVAEPLLEAAEPIGYMSGWEQRQNIMDIVMQVDAFADKTLTMAESGWVDGHGEHGSKRDYLEIAFRDLERQEKDANTEEEKEKVRAKIDAAETAAIKSLRKAGFLVTFPNKSLPSDHDLNNMVAHGEIDVEMMPREGLSDQENQNRQKQLIKRLKALGRWQQKRPYVTWGIQPIFWEEGGVGSDGQYVYENKRAEGLELYGHRGKEVLMTIILLEFLTDQLKITELDAQRTLLTIHGNLGSEADIRRTWETYKQVRQSEIARLSAEEAVEKQGGEEAPKATTPPQA